MKYIMLLLLLAGSLLSYAHSGTHDTGSPENGFNDWRLKNGTVIKGNFLYGRGNKLVLRQYGGKLLALPVNSLCPRDERIARFKIKRLQNLNLMPPGAVETAESFNPAKSALLIALCSIMAVAFLFFLNKAVSFVNPVPGYRAKPALAAISILALGFLYAFRKTAEQINYHRPPKTGTAFLAAAFHAGNPGVSTRWDDSWFYVSSNGLPAHNMMEGITNWQQQVPLPQPYFGTNSWAIPLQPEIEPSPLSTKNNFMKGAVAIAINGIPIFNALNNRGEDAYLIGELDAWGGHCGRADDYHYHAAPLHLSALAGLQPIGFALDGFPVYGNTEPDGGEMKPLDFCHGHFYRDSLYHYHGTHSYPYVIGAMRGRVTVDDKTPAPENRIIPQPSAAPTRPAAVPLRGASITAFEKTAPNACKLSYKTGSRFAFIEYSWDDAGVYRFVFTDSDSTVTVKSFQRRR